MTDFVNILTAGDTLDFPVVVSNYKASDGWSLKYRLAPRVSGTVIDLTAVASGDDYRVQVTAASTSAWAAGFYSWSAFVEKAAERYSVSRGTLEIRVSSVAMPAGYDSRTHAQKTLDAIKAVIEKRASLDQQEYSIHGRQLKRMTIDELLKFRVVYEREVANEIVKERLAAGLPAGGKVQVRF